MRNRRQRRPEVEGLESKALLSGVVAAFHVHSAYVVVEANTVAAGQTSPAPADQTVSVSGRVTGTYSATATANGGESYTFNGAGFVAPLGVTNMTATTTLSVFTANPGATPSASTGQTTGTVTLSNASGTITLGLTGPDINMSSVHPDVWHYTITSATGAYQGETGSGYMDFIVVPTSSTSNSEQGTFTAIFVRGGTPPPP